MVAEPEPGVAVHRASHRPLHWLRGLARCALMTMDGRQHVGSAVLVLKQIFGRQDD